MLQLSTCCVSGVYFGVKPNVGTTITFPFQEEGTESEREREEAEVVHILLARSLCVSSNQVIWHISQNYYKTLVVGSSTYTYDDKGCGLCPQHPCHRLLLSGNRCAHLKS